MWQSNIFGWEKRWYALFKTMKQTCCEVSLVITIWNKSNDINEANLFQGMKHYLWFVNDFIVSNY